MLTRDIAAFFAFAKTCEPEFPSCAKGVYLVTPEAFSLAAESAQDNVYMDMQQLVSSDVALAQHMKLVQSLSGILPAVAFSGRPETPDAIFPNNVFATAKNRTTIKFCTLNTVCTCIRKKKILFTIFGKDLFFLQI